ncbi:TPA: hypothetical protein ENS27_16055 [bacterium]|nr:hypothetical protein [bacterium]
MDFQVKALIGNVTVSGGDSDSLIYNMLYPTYTFTGESSDWSNTQTISIGQSGFISSNIIVLAPISVIIIIVLVITSILLFRRHRKTVYLKQ